MYAGFVGWQLVTARTSGTTIHTFPGAFLLHLFFSKDDKLQVLDYALLAGAKSTSTIVSAVIAEPI